MALEDRCSPQSAPSPPGIAHSPQSTASSPVSSILDMSLHRGHRGHSPLHPSDSTTNLISSYNQKMSPSVRDEHHFSDDEIEVSIKDEKENDSIMDDQDSEQEHISVPVQPQIPLISFSITNILSDRFGNNKSYISDGKKPTGAIFRPFDIPRRSPTPQPEKSAFTRLVPDIIDYSRAPVLPPAPAAAILPNPLLIERANFFSCFNPATYPRIHEEILNSRRNSRTNDIQIPPLGSLCKTVSQIGQTASQHHQQSASQSLCLSSPPPASILSTSSSGSNNSTSGSPSSSCRMPPNNNSNATSPQPSLVSATTTTTQSLNGRDSGMESSDDTRSECGSTKDDNGQQLWPAWVYCTRYSDRPSSGPRYRRPKQPKEKNQNDEKRPRTAFSSEQLARLKHEFNENRYLTERRRQQLSSELGLNEAQIKIWFQNKRAKIKKSSGTKNPLAIQLMAQGLYNHSTVPLTKEEEELEMRMNGQL